MTPREKSIKRIKKLTEAYIQQKNLEIIEENLNIDSRNQTNKQLHKEKYKHNINVPKFIPEEHLPKYTKKQFTEEISTKYYLRFEYAQYNQYINGHAYPTLELLHGLSETFGVSLDYLSGYSDIPNPTTATISTLLPLKSESLQTLVKLCSSGIYTDMLNALLCSADTTAGLLQNIHNQLQQRFEQNFQIQNNIGPSNQHLLLSTMYYEEFLSRLEHALLPVLKEEFEQKIALDNAFINRDLSHYSTAFHHTKKDS